MTSFDVSVVIPARDEATTLPILLGSLARSVVRPLEIIVVDDGSTDDTIAVARAHGARVVEAGPLPAGWAGKPWACATGVAASSASMLVFLDADVWLAPDALGRLVQLGDVHRGLVSVQPAHHPVRLVEEASALFNLSAVLGSGAFAARHDHPARVAFGPCLVTRRDDYELAGGHAAARGSVIEDVALARSYAAAGLPVRCLLGDSDVGFRMYAGGLRPIVDGWTKNIALGAGSGPRLAVAAVVVWVVALAAVGVDVVHALIHWAGGSTPSWTVPAAYALLATHLWWLLRRVGRFRWITAALFPVPTVFFVVVFLRSAFAVLTKGTVSWRGREVATRASREAAR